MGSGAKSSKKNGTEAALPKSRSQSTGTAAAIRADAVGLVVRAAARKLDIAERPSGGGMIPRPVRLILAAATGSAAMPAAVWAFSIRRKPLPLKLRYSKLKGAASYHWHVVRLKKLSDRRGSTCTPCAPLHRHYREAARCSFRDHGVHGSICSCIIGLPWGPKESCG